MSKASKHAIVMQSISQRLAEISCYIDEHLLCGSGFLANVKSEECLRLLALKAYSMNLLTECEVYCAQATRIIDGDWRQQQD